MLKKSIMMLLTFCMILSIFSCAKKDEEEKEIQSKEEQKQVSSEEILPKAFEGFVNENLKILQWYTPEQREAEKQRGSDQPIYYAADKFKEKYGGEVELIYSDWANLMTTCANMQAAGEAPDLVWAHCNIYPRIAHSEVVMPIDEVEGFDPEFFYNDSTSNTAYKGKTYFIQPIDPKAKPSNWVGKLTYNKTMCEQNLVKTPVEFFDEGNWTFDTFLEVGRATTRDLDGDGTYDQWGAKLQNIIDVFTIANGSGLTKMTANGLESNLLDPKVITAFDYVQKVYAAPEQGGITPYGSVGGMDENTLFNNSQVCMIWEWNSVGANFPDEIGYAPYPSGPDNKDKALYCMIEGWCVPVGAKNQESALAWVYFKSLDESMVEFDTKDFFSRYSDDQQEFAQNLWTKFNDPYGDKQNYNFHTAFNFPYDNAYGLFANLENDIVINQMPAATVAEKYDSVLTGYLEKTYS